MTFTYAGIVIYQTNDSFASFPHVIVRADAPEHRCQSDFRPRFMAEFSEIEKKKN